MSRTSRWTSFRYPIQYNAFPSSSSREKIMIHGRALYNCLPSMRWPNRIGDDTWRFLSWSWSWNLAGFLNQLPNNNG